jgi:RNA polymerase sigma factor (sigma-70 family)
VSDESVDLLARWRTGDQNAADVLFQRYAKRLMVLARTRLAEKLAARIDPEDVIQSAYRSFFHHARAGDYALQRTGDLWRLLVAITLHKLHHQVKRHTAARRTPDREVPLPDREDGGDPPVEVLAAGPSPAEAATLADELEHLLQQLDPPRRRIVELRLQGYNLEEIASQVHCCQRTVRRTMEGVRQYLERRARA